MILHEQNYNVNYISKTCIVPEVITLEISDHLAVTWTAFLFQGPIH